MDLGATICTPRRPSCLLCPFETTCRAHREGREEALPSKAERKAVPRRRATLLLATRCDAVLLERRPPTGIWGGLWSLPELPVELDPDELARQRFGDEARVSREGGFVHGFTHYVLEADVVRVMLDDRASAPPQVRDGVRDERWVVVEELAGLGLPAPIRTLLAAKFS